MTEPVEAHWEDAIQALEGASTRLKRTDVDNLPLIGEILAERAQAVSRVAALVGAGSRLGAERIGRLERALAVGSEVAHNLRLLRSLTRAQLVRSQQEAFILRSLGSTGAAAPRLIDQRG
jgi:uncharacterized protein with ACT and thioredoxin-like domain